MRKELVMFIETSEKGIESSFRALKGHPEYVLIEHEGHRFAVPAKELSQALFELEFFYQNNPVKEESEALKMIEPTFDVEYGAEDV